MNADYKSNPAVRRHLLIERHNDEKAKLDAELAEEYKKQLQVLKTSQLPDGLKRQMISQLNMFNGLAPELNQSDNEA